MQRIRTRRGCRDVVSTYQVPARSPAAMATGNALSVIRWSCSRGHFRWGATTTTSHGSAGSAPGGIRRGQTTTTRTRTDAAELARGPATSTGGSPAQLAQFRTAACGRSNSDGHQLPISGTVGRRIGHRLISPRQDHSNAQRHYSACSRAAAASVLIPHHRCSSAPAASSPCPGLHSRSNTTTDAAEAHWAPAERSILISQALPLASPTSAADPDQNPLAGPGRCACAVSTTNTPATWPRHSHSTSANSFSFSPSTSSPFLANISPPSQPQFLPQTRFRDLNCVHSPPLSRSLFTAAAAGLQHPPALAEVASSPLPVANRLAARPLGPTTSQIKASDHQITQTRKVQSATSARLPGPYGQPSPRRTDYFFSTIRIMPSQQHDVSTVAVNPRELHTADMIPFEPSPEMTHPIVHQDYDHLPLLNPLKLDDQVDLVHENDIEHHHVHTHMVPHHGPSPKSSRDSLLQSGNTSDEEISTTPATEPQFDEDLDSVPSLPLSSIEYTEGKPRRASTSLLTQDGEELRKILGNGETGTKLIQKYCCGGGCCLAKPADVSATPVPPALPTPYTDAFKSLKINLGTLSLDDELTATAELPPSNLSFVQIPQAKAIPRSPLLTQPPEFVQPHPPYHVFSAPVFNARELTRPGAEKRTFHFDVDVTDYPDEGGVDFKVGGAIGICPPNDNSVVEELFDRLGVPKFIRDKPVTLKTGGGRWPTIWGDDIARELTTTRRELLTWCSDLQSTPPTKPLIRLLAEHASDVNEKKILTYLVSQEGQGAFCDLRTGPHLTINQLLDAFPSSHPPLEDLMSTLKQIMPRFYSLSNDPHISSDREGLSGRRLIEMAVTIHELDHYKDGKRTGVGSGYMERIAKAFIAAKEANPDSTPEFRIPMFRGLMANPLSREFVSDGPMMLIGAGVGMAPFRGFILNRLKNANCANKIWLLQGVRDSTLDEIYRGELGKEESQIKRVVQSRKADKSVGEAKYVQEEVLHQADIVWFVVNAVDGRVFVCGSSKGMGEGVHEALVSVAMDKGGLDREQAEAFWSTKKEGGQYIAETW